MNRSSIILVKGNNKYITFEKDLQIIKYINFNLNYNYCNLSYLDKYNINYIILDNLDVVDEKKYVVNNYKKYLLLSYLYKILINISNY